MAKAILTISILLIFSLSEAADSAKWNLQRCIDHALENNLQMKRLKLDKSGSDLSYRAAKAAQYPSVSGSIGYSLSPEIGGKRESQDVSYSANARWTVFEGTAIRTDIKMKELEIQKSEESIKGQEISLIQSITNAYLQVFYAKEALQSSIIARDASMVQRDRTKELLSVGSATKIDLAKMEASLATDEYNVVIATNSLKQKQRALNSLLELPADSLIDISFPDLSDSINLEPIPDIQQIYSAALEKMPGVASSQLSREIAALGIKKAMAGYFPSLSLSAGVSTGNDFETSFVDQVSDRVNLRIGASLSIPIYDRRQTKTNLEKAKISAKQAELALMEEQKELLEEVQDAYYNAEAARSKLIAAQVQYQKSLQSYELAQEQFKLGLINSTDLLIEKNAWLVSLREHLESKINALMTMQMINIYMGMPVQI
jgi:outer membrane protein